MNGDRTPSEHCRTMAEVRHGVDRLDEEVVARLAERFRYMDAAARIKKERGAVRDEERKAQVLTNVARLAAAEGAPVAEIHALYERLIEASIAHELARFDGSHAPPGEPENKQ